MRLIDADALWMVTEGNHEYYERFEIDEAPTVDAVPVIRCRDCKFLRFTGTVWKCQNRLVMMMCEPNDYCSRAERKDNETN